MTEPEILTQAYLVQGAYSFLDQFLEDPQYPGDAVLLAALNNLLKAGLGENDECKHEAGRPCLQ